MRNYYFPFRAWDFGGDTLDTKGRCKLVGTRLKVGIRYSSIVHSLSYSRTFSDLGVSSFWVNWGRRGFPELGFLTCQDMPCVF